MKYDVIVLGCGPAGYYFAKNYSKSNKRIAIIEKEKLGGVGFRTGCLPVKKYLDLVRDINIGKKLIKGQLMNGEFPINKLYSYVRDDLYKIEELIEKDLKSLNIDLYSGDVEFLSKNKLKINDGVIEFHKCVLATGTSPKGMGDVNIDENIILSHKRAIDMEELPEDICIVGGNVEGIEFASLFASLGVKVTVIDMENEVLRGNDKDLKELTINYLKENNVEFILNSKVKNINIKDSKAELILEEGSLYASKILITGIRKPNIPRGLREIGVKVEESCIPVDDYFRTNVDNIYAIGDINGILGMAHVALNQGIELSEYMMNNIKPKRNYNSLPRAIYTIYEMAGAGYQENELGNKEYMVNKVYFKDTFRGFSKGIEEGFLKIIADKDRKVIGLWISSENASDLIGDVGLWIDSGLTIDDIKNKLFIHPTLGEAILEAALKF